MSVLRTNLALSHFFVLHLHVTLQHQQQKYDLTMQQMNSRSFDEVHRTGTTSITPSLASQLQKHGR
jgi:uncharacterized membrane protein